MTPIPKPCGCCCMGHTGGYAKRWVVVVANGSGVFSTLNNGILLPFAIVNTLNRSCVYQCSGAPGYTLVSYVLFASSTSTFTGRIQVNAQRNPGFRFATGTHEILSSFVCGQGAYGVEPSYVGGSAADGVISGLMYARPYRTIAQAVAAYPNLIQHCRPTEG